MVGAFSFEGPSVVLQQVRVRLTDKMGMTDMVLKVNFLTFKNVGRRAPIYLENTTPPYSFMRHPNMWVFNHSFPLWVSGSIIRHVGEGPLVPHLVSTC